MSISEILPPEPCKRILVVDDEESMRHMLRLVLERAGYAVHTAPDAAQALEILRLENQDFDVVLCDLRMPRMDGLAFTVAARRIVPDVVIVIMSAFGTVESALEAVRRGAWDFVSKPFKGDELVFTLRKVEERARLARENAVLRAEVARHRRLSSILVGSDTGLRSVAEAAQKVASSTVTVLLTGESGTGKDVLARAIHEMSPRSARAFIAVNCAAIPENLLESELLGHERGAFTGAVRTRPGLFEQASGGTLLLDEIGEMPLPLQVKLLRVIEGGTVRRVGGERDIEVDVRLLAATSRDLPALVVRGLFREDLFYRLNVVNIRIPPLRERTEDIPILADHLIHRLAVRMDRPCPRFSPGVMRILECHPWPGNVRQLENACERALLLGDGKLIVEDDMPPEILAPLQPRPEARADGDLSIKRQVAILERDLIRQALEKSRGNRAGAARELEISYKALLYKIREYGLES